MTKVTQFTLEVCQQVISDYYLIIPPLRLIIPTTPSILPHLWQVIIILIDVATSAPHHLTWREFTLSYTIFCRISPHLQILFSNTWRNFPSIKTNPSLSHTILYYQYRSHIVPFASSLHLNAQYLLQYLRVTLGINKAAIIGSCYTINPQDTPTLTVNNRSVSFTIFFSKGIRLKRGPK